MKVEIRTYIMGILILLFSISCGQEVRQTMSPVVPDPADGRLKRIVILPFADYTLSFSSYGHWRRNLLVHEAVQDELYKAGFVPAAEEAVSEYLLRKGVFRYPYEVSATVDSLQREMQENWSDQMKEEMAKTISENIKMSRKLKKERDNRKLVAINSQMIKDLGDNLGADYVVRGRIVEFRWGHEDTFNFVKIGFLPCIFKTSHRMVFGLADSESYEAVDMASIGGTIRRALAETDYPFDGYKADPDYFFDNSSTEEAYSRVSDMVWGAGRFAAGVFGDRQGKVPEATVQLRMLIQDGRTGEVVWLNRAEVSVTPESTYAAHDRYTLFQKAIHKTVKSLVRNFIDTLERGGVPTIDSAGLTVAAEMLEASKLEAAKAKEAAADANEAAKKARESAEMAEGAAGEAGEAAKSAEESSMKSEKIFKKTIRK
ncbi:MAG: hypothetical protein DRP09_21610 [Candidatus Thorarchaeota archaeon]|nr:MAG: hypothetical protein DRP09_21610 [Candidatus Thorarchaeota archaeon]